MRAKLARLKYLIGKAIQYLLEIAQQPKEVPRLVYYTCRGVHVGEFLNLNKPWLKQHNVKTVIDVGANAGQFSSAVSCVLPDARIFSFEPLEHCYRALVKRMSSRKNFEARCLAIGERTGRVSFNSNEFSKSSSLLAMERAHREAFPWTAQTNEVTVDIDTLDNAVAEMKIERPVLLKLDIQGSELAALHGANKTLQDVDLIISEVSFQPLYENQPLFDDIYSFLNDHGFAYYGSLGSLVSPKDGTVLQEDALFLRKQ